MTSAEVGSLVGFLAACYPSWKPPEHTVAAWSVMLASVDGAASMRAARRHAATNKWAPSPSELLERVAQELEPLPEPVEIMAEVLAAARKVRWGREPENLTPVAAQVVAAIGWGKITDSKNPEALRAHLVKAAETYRHRVAAEAMERLAGLPPLARLPALSAGEAFTANARRFNAARAHEEAQGVGLA
jgi:hypothetical protein